MLDERARVRARSESPGSSSAVVRLPPNQALRGPPLTRGASLPVRSDMEKATHENLVNAGDDKVGSFVSRKRSEVQHACRTVRRRVDQDFRVRIRTLDLRSIAQPESGTGRIALGGVGVQGLRTRRAGLSSRVQEVVRRSVRLHDASTGEGIPTQADKAARRIVLSASSSRCSQV